MPKYKIPDWVQGDFRRYVRLERNLRAGATSCHYEAQTIPGLLQTREYAVEVLTACLLQATPQMVQKRADFRMARQQPVLTGDRSCHFIIDAAAIDRQVGSPAVMSAQLAHLIHVAELPNVTIRIIPVTSGAYPSMGHPYVIVWLTPARAQLFLENGIDTRLDRLTALPGEYGSVFIEQAERALPIPASLAFLRQAAQA